jgi:hypothetical protein
MKIFALVGALVFVGIIGFGVYYLVTHLRIKDPVDYHPKNEIENEDKD